MGCKQSKIPTSKESKIPTNISFTRKTRIFQEDLWGPIGGPMNDKTRKFGPLAEVMDINFWLDVTMRSWNLRGRYGVKEDFRLSLRMDNEWLLGDLDTLDEMIDDYRHWMEENDKGGKFLYNDQHYYGTMMHYDAMNLDCCAKDCENMAIGCQRHVIEYLNWIRRQSNEQQAKYATIEKAVERIQQDFEIAEIRARTAREIITSILPDINSHPFRAKADKNWKSSLVQNKLMLIEARKRKLLK